MGITGIYNVEVGRSLRSDVRSLHEAMFRFTELPDGCRRVKGVSGARHGAASLQGILTFGGAGPSIRALTFAVGRGSLPRWRAKLSQRHTRIIGRAWQFDEEHLCFLDDSGFDLSLAEIDSPAVGHDANGILGLRGIEVADRPNGELETILRTVGMTSSGEEGPIIRYELPTGPSALAIDVFRTTPILPPSLAIDGPAQRISFELAVPQDVEQVGEKLRDAGLTPLPLCDHTSALAVRLRSQRNLEIGFLCAEPAVPA